jgi:galactoside O-acetyltransferase
MGFYSRKELKKIGFKYVGKNVKVSKKASIYEAQKIILHDNCRIDDFCVLSGKIEIGNNVHIAVFCNLAGGDEGIRLDDFSGLAYYSNIFTRSDDYSGKTMTNPTIPDKYKNIKKAPIYIGKHSIVGTNSTVFPGVEIAEGCSIGAYSLVTKSTKPWKVYFGIPAKPIKERKKDLLELEREYHND